jgi:hypothetical protein
MGSVMMSAMLMLLTLLFPSLQHSYDMSAKGSLAAGVESLDIHSSVAQHE